MAFILVVDDDELVAEIIADTLWDAGHVVEVCATAQAALDAIGLRRADLILLDHDLPDMSGVALLRKMRGDPAMAMIPVLMLSGHHGERDRLAAMDAGAAGYMTKPFQADALLARLDEMLAASPGLVKIRHG